MPRDFESGSSQSLRNTGLPPGLASDGQPLTMACWYKPESFPVNTLMCVSANDADNHFHRLDLAGTASTKLRAASAAGGTTIAATTTGSMTAGTWYHCAATFGPTSGVDRSVHLTPIGGSTEVVTNTTNRVPTVHQTGLGCIFGATPAGFSDGIMAHAAMWLAQLTNAEIRALSQGAHPFRIRPASLVCYWPLFGFDPEPDFARGRLSMTLSNAPAIGLGGPPVEIHDFGIIIPSFDAGDVEPPSTRIVDLIGMQVVPFKR